MPNSIASSTGSHPTIQTMNTLDLSQLDHMTDIFTIAVAPPLRQLNNNNNNNNNDKHRQRSIRFTSDHSKSSAPAMPEMSNSARILGHLRATVTDDTTTSIISQRPATVTYKHRSSRFTRAAPQDNITASDVSAPLPRVNITSASDINPSTNHSQIPAFDTTIDNSDHTFDLSPSKTANISNTRTRSSFLAPQSANTPQTIRPSLIARSNIPLPRDEQDIYGNIDAVKAQVASLEKQLTHASRQIQQQNIEIEALKQSNAKLQRSNERKASRIANMDELADGLPQAFEDFKAKVKAELNAERFSLSEENAKLKFELEASKQQSAENPIVQHDQFSNRLQEFSNKLNHERTTRPTLSHSARKVMDELVTKQTVRVTKPVPVSKRMPQTGPHQDEATVRPSMDPGLALRKVIKSLEAEVSQLQSEHNGAAAAYNNCDVSLGYRARRSLKNRMDELVVELEKKSHQVYRLYDALEGSKDADVKEKMMDMTISSITG